MKKKRSEDITSEMNMKEVQRLRSMGIRGGGDAQ